MPTNKERIKTIYRLNEEIQVLLEKESDLYKKALENKDNKLIIQRNGKEVEISEKELWEEIRGVSSFGDIKQIQATKILQKMYPDAFEAATKRDEKNLELGNYILEMFGFDFHQMTIANYLKLTEAMFDYKFEEYERRNKEKK